MGCFDSVEYTCPHCGTVLTEQSKAGDCSLQTYQLNDVPIEIAVDLSGVTMRCNCGAKFLVRFVPVTTRVALKIEEIEK